MEGMLEGATENPRNFGESAEQETDPGPEIATPEEQQDYELLTIRARKMMFGKGKNKVLSLLGSGESPSKALGKAGSMLVKSLMQSSKQQGRHINAEVAINAGSFIVSELNELGKSAGVFQYDSPEEEEKEIKEGVLWGVKLYGDGMLQNGEISPEMSKLAQKQVVEGIRAENEAMPEKTGAAAAVSEAVNPSPQGLVGGIMEEGV